MADGPRLEVALEVAAPADRVWDIVSDVTRVGGWGGECQWAEWLDDGGPVPGARFRGGQKREDREWETVSTVTAAEPGVTFAWAVGPVDNAAASWSFDLIPQGAGTLVRYSARLGPGPSGLTAVIEDNPDLEERIIARRIEEHRVNMTRTLEAIREAAET